MGSRLQGKVAVVTGSTSGIGAGIATAMASEGACVVVSGRRAPEGDAVVEGIRAAGGTAVFQQTDLRRPEECRQLCQRAAAEFGGLDILVNNAGIFPRLEFEQLSVEFWDAIMETNVRGAFLCSQAAVPLMRARGGGALINIGSSHAFGTRERLFAYGCSKGALYVMTMNLARMLAPQRIRVNWITVGWVLTEKEYAVQESEGVSREALHQRAEELPMGEFSTVDDIARACVYLATDEAAHITGSNVNTGAGIGIHL